MECKLDGKDDEKNLVGMAIHKNFNNFSHFHNRFDIYQS